METEENKMKKEGIHVMTIRKECVLGPSPFLGRKEWKILREW
jgi:hypothetical protein